MSSNPRPHPAVFLGISIFLLAAGLIWAAVGLTYSPSPDAEAELSFSREDSWPAASFIDSLQPRSISAADTFIKIGPELTGVSGAVDTSQAEPEKDSQELLDQEAFWLNRLTYPTGRFDPVWLRRAAEQDSLVQRSVPAGRPASFDRPTALDPNSFTSLGPKPERMTGCSNCFDYGITQGRVNAIVVDPTTTTSGSIVAYIANIGGGVAKTTNCCSASTTWEMITDHPLITTTGVDTLAIDHNDHNVVYAGTGDLNFGSFSMGSQGILKTTDAGATWTVLGADVFGAAYVEPAGQFPQYDAVGKVRIDPNNSNRVVAGTKKGIFISYNGGQNWTGPCTTNTFATQRQDTTGLELSDMGSGITRILVAIGTRGFATPVQYDLGNQGANGLYKGTMPASGCPGDFTLISRNDNGFIFGNAVAGSPYTTGALMNAGTGVPYSNTSTGNQLSRMDIAVAPSNANYIYAQVGSIAANSSGGCGSSSGCQLGIWSSTDGGTTWAFMTGSSGASLRACASGGTAGTGSNSPGSGDYPQNWYDQGMAVDPNNPDRLFVDTFDTWLALRTGTNLYNVTCGYSSGPVSSHVVHVDHHALAFVAGSSNILLEGSDGGIFSTSNAAAAAEGVLRPTWVNMDTGLNTIEFYAGDISGNFANSAAPVAVGGAQDNGPSSATFPGTPTGPVQWQMGLGGDGFSGQIDPMGTGTSLRMWQGNNSGGLSRCVSNCTNSGAAWTSSRGSWGGDQQSFVLPINMFHGGIPGGDDCGPPGPTTGCGHLIAGTTRVWETISGTNASVPSSAWYNTNSTSCSGGSNPCLTKGTLGVRSFINQVKYSPKFQSVAIVGTNDGNVQIGFNLGTGVANQGNWINVTGGNTVLPNRPILSVSLDASVPAANVPVGYAGVGGFNANSPSTPGHVFQVTCAATCGSFAWLDKTGNLPDIPVDSIINNPNFPQQVFAGTDFGLYFTNDINEASPVWYRFTNGLPAVMIWDMQIDRGATTLSLWTRGRGAYVWPLPLGPFGSPTPTPSETPVTTPTPTATSTPTNTPTDTPTASATATSTPTDTPTATETTTATPTPGCTPVYTFTVETGAIDPGTNDIGNHCNDCSTEITLPFSYTLYDQTFTSVQAGSNGHLTFGTVNNNFLVSCLPIVPTTYVIAPFWGDQCTTVGGCNVGNVPGRGIFTSVTGTEPNRVFNIEYRTTYFGGALPLDYEVRLFEGQTNFDVVYGTINSLPFPNDSQLSAGVEKNSDAGNYTVAGCDTTGGQAPPVSSGQVYHYTLQTSCETPTPTATSTPTNTQTATPQNTPTATATNTQTPTNTPTNTPTASATATSTPTSTPTNTPTGTPSESPTPTPTNTSTPTNTPTSTPTITPSPTPPLRSRADFDGDGRTDLSVFRPSDGNWYYQGSASGFNAIHFGESTDIPAPGDFDNDGKTDLSVFRPSTGYWYRMNSSDGTVSFVEWGLNGDIPQAADYDGDARADQGVFRPSSGTWYWIRSSDNQPAGIQFGQNGDKPVVGDYDGDSKADVSVFRGGIWYRTNSSDGALYAEQFGIDTDNPVPADYDGDNHDDIAVFRPSQGNWYFHFSGNGLYGGIHWGTTGDVPVPGDYDADNIYDVGVYRDGIWYINGSTESISPFPFGLADDIPIPKMYIP